MKRSFKGPSVLKVASRVVGCLRGDGPFRLYRRAGKALEPLAVSDRGEPIQFRVTGDLEVKADDETLFLLDWHEEALHDPGEPQVVHLAEGKTLREEIEEIVNKRLSMASEAGGFETADEADDFEVDDDDDGFVSPYELRDMPDDYPIAEPSSSVPRDSNGQEAAELQEGTAPAAPNADPENLKKVDAAPPAL